MVAAKGQLEKKPHSCDAFVLILSRVLGVHFNFVTTCKLTVFRPQRLQALSALVSGQI